MESLTQVELAVASDNMKDAQAQEKQPGEDHHIDMFKQTTTSETFESEVDVQSCHGNRNTPQRNITPENKILPEKTKLTFNRQHYLKMMSSRVVSTNESSKVRVNINVGGVIFQTLEETIKHVPAFCDPYFKLQYDTLKEEYFFDRDPEVFRCVLNYWRTGKLHLPLGRCGPSMSDELELWGLEELDIQPCCWHSYNSGLHTGESLEKLRRNAIQDEDRTYFSLKPKNLFLKLRLDVWFLLTTPTHSKAAKVYEYGGLFLALLSIFSFCASTSSVFQVTIQNSTSEISEDSNITVEYESSRSSKVIPILIFIDYACLVFFTVEIYLLTFCAPNLCKFLCSVTAVIDVLAIMPDYVEMIVDAFPKNYNTSNLTEFLLLLRLMRVIRVFRVIRRVPGLWIMMYTLTASYKDLFLMLMFLLIGTLLFGSVIFYVDDNTVFTSIPQSFWWAIVTMTTVGYGDMVPKTAGGQLVGSMTTVCGVLLIGFTIPSLVNNFIVYYNLVQFDARQKKLLILRAAQRGCSVDELENFK